MTRSRTQTEIKEGVALQHRVALGLTALTLGAAALGLSVALLAAPGGISNELFRPTDVAVHTNSTADAVTLTWTAPGDDGSIGQATEYDLRYSTSQLTAATFTAATRVNTVSAPLPAGSTESFTVSALSPDTTYYFALKATDEAGNQSGISNVLAVTTAAVSQACVPQYSCSAWSACVNDRMTRTCTVTNNCPAGLGAPVEQQACTSPGTGGTVPGDPVGTTPSDPVGGTTPGEPVGGGQPGVTNPMVVAGLAPGNQPKVRILNTRTLGLKKEFSAYRSTNKYGVFVAAGDVDGDDRAEVIVGTGPKSSAIVTLFTDAGRKIVSFAPFGSRSTVGVSVAVGDVDGDGKAEILTIPASGAGSLKAFRYNATTRRVTLLGSLPAGTYRGGYTIASADLDLDGRAEVVIAKNVNSRGLSTYRWNGSRFIRTKSFSAFPITFRSGIKVAAGDVTGDGRPEILAVAGAGYWSDVRVFTPAGRQVSSVVPFSKSFFGGAALTTHDMNGDGQDEVLVSPAKGAEPFIRVFRYNHVTRKLDRLQSRNVFPAKIRTGLRLGGV